MWTKSCPKRKNPKTWCITFSLSMRHWIVSEWWIISLIIPSWIIVTSAAVEVYSQMMLLLFFFNVIFYYSFPCCFARLLLIAAMTFAEFYIPFVELSKIALLFVVFRSRVWTKFTFCRFLLRTPWVLVLFLERSHQADITSTHPLNWRQIKHFIALSQLFLPKKSLVSKFFVNLHS